MSDKASHVGILLKLNSYNLPRPLYNWIKDFLAKRSFHVTWNSANSRSHDILTGVPQGSCLSPTIFNIFFSDIAHVIAHPVNKALYADDLLREDLQHAVNCLKKLIKISLTANQISALISLVFNVGCGDFASSKALKLINQNNLEKAKIELFDRTIGFVRIGNKIIKGLVNRRALEEKLWDLHV